MIAVVQFFGSWLSRVRVYGIGRPPAPAPTMSGARASHRSCWPRLSQPRPFSILVEFRTRAISTPSTIGGAPRRKDAQPATHREKGAVVMATRSDVRKGIFQDGSDEEQTFGDRDHGGKWLPQICGPRLFRFADARTVAMVSL